MEDEGGPSGRREVQKPSRSYELLESSASEDDSEHEKRKKRKKKKRRRRRNESEERGGFGEYGSRKSDVRAWADADGRPSKDYYFDSNGDRDNLAFGSLYRYLCRRNLIVLNPSLLVVLETWKTSLNRVEYTCFEI